MAAIREPIQLSPKIPYDIAKSMMLPGRHKRMNAKRAYEVGLVSEVLPRDQLIARASELAELLLQNDSHSLMATIEASYKSLETGMLAGIKQGLPIRARSGVD